MLDNAYIDTGHVIRKRPGLTLDATLDASTVGLFSAGGKLHSFHGNASIGAAPFGYQYDQLGTTPLTELNFADLFSGQIYASVDDNTPATKHYYNGTLVSDVNCPNTKECIKIGSKIYAVGTNGLTRFASTANPADWTAANDAGFINTGNQTPGDPEPKAFGIYSGQLIVFGIDSAQLWAVDSDPANIAIQKTVHNIGCQYNRTPTNVSGDLYFLTDYGVRSIATQAYTNLLYDIDIGAHVDALVKAALATATTEPQALFYQGGKQFWLAIGSTVFIYTFSRSSKVSAWSRYTYPFNIEYMAELNGQLYLRSGNNVYLVDDTVFTDNGVSYTVDIETTFQDFGKSGQLKHVIGFDSVTEGTATLEFMTDVNNDTQKTPGIAVSGDTRPYGAIPIEILGTEIGVRITNTDSNDFRLQMMSFYYSILGIV